MTILENKMRYKVRTPIITIEISELIMNTEGLPKQR
jgi:hypothetical protein